MESFSNTHQGHKRFDLGPKNSKLCHASIPLRNLKIEIEIFKSFKDLVAPGATLALFNSITR
jgi:hypothetical protein